MHIQDLGTSAYLARGEEVRAVGWLEASHPVRKGPVAPEFLHMLRTHVNTAYQPFDFMGFHRCSLCEQFKGSANLLVPTQKLLYVAPAMVLHYVEDHGYQPPAEFVQAVMACPPQGSAQYLELIEPFAHTWRPKGAPIVQRAGFWRRTGAYAIDALLTTVPTVAVFYFFLGFDEVLAAYRENRGSTQARMHFLEARGWVRNACFFVYMCYCTIMEATRLQATVGKRALGLRVEELNGRPMSLPRSFARNFTKPVSLLPLGLGFLWAAFSKQKRTWHDMMSKSRVVRVLPG